LIPKMKEPLNIYIYIYIYIYILYALYYFPNTMGMTHLKMRQEKLSTKKLHKRYERLRSENPRKVVRIPVEV